LIGQLREVGGGRPRFGAAPAFSLAVIVLIVAAIASSAGWPHDAKIVPLTACGMALVAAVLNLVNELFGREQTVDAHADATVQVRGQSGNLGIAPDLLRRRATLFFVWMALFIAAVALIGFIPAIAVFVSAYMAFGFGEPPLPSLGYAAATTLLCWVVFHWALRVAWPQSLLGDLFPELRAVTGLI
jgi:hypothetical protein